MSTESIQPVTTRQPAVQSNPFAKHQSEHVSAGTVAIESERAIAEAQGKLIIAKRFPRNQAVAYANIIDACRRPGLADEACYSFPRGGEVVNGPTIRLAEMLAANWGNLDYGLRELSRKEGVSEMEAYAWDLETNVMSSQKFTVRHLRDTRNGQKQLTDERDIYELTANLGARRLRARVLAVIPADLIQAAVDQCGKTAASGGDVPIADRIRKMVVAFKTLGVPAALIEKRLEHPLDSATGEELADLLKIHNSLRDGMSKLTDWFGGSDNKGEPGATQEDDIPMGDAPAEQRAPVPEKKKKGATAAANTTPAPEKTEPKTEAPAQEKPTEKPALATTPPPEGKVFTQSSTAATKDAEPTKPDPTPEARVFIKDGEEVVVNVTVKESRPAFVTMDNKRLPSVIAKVAGQFNNEVIQHNVEPLNMRQEKDKDVFDLPPIWTVGASLKIKLLGKHFPAVKKVYAVVQSVEALPVVEGEVG